MTPVLYSFWRATAPYRIRIGLGLKGLDYVYSPVDLAAGEQRGAAYRAVNRQGLTPALAVGDGQVLIQSLAILEWLEETHPQPPLLPVEPLARQVVRAMALIIACDIHPLNNARVGRRLDKMGIDPASVLDWTQGWIRDGFDALEPMIAAHGRGFAYGEAPTLADCCLVPQVYSAHRFQVDLAPYPAIRAAAERAAAHPAFQAAHPDRQPDAVPA
jgi:maleylacetoacetate isomerase/maleylpyruvate isomerase